MGASSPGRVFDPNCEVTEAYAAMDERRAIKFLRSFQTVAGRITILYVYRCPDRVLCGSR